MSDEDTIRARRTADGRLEQILPDGSTRPLEDRSDWTRVDAMTDEEAYQNALDDPDNPPLTPEQLARMYRVPSPKQLRLQLNLTQEEFARQFHIGLYTLRDWEAGAWRPNSVAKTYLRVIEAIPDAVRQALDEDQAQHSPTVEEGAEAPRRRAG